MSCHHDRDLYFGKRELPLRVVVLVVCDRGLIFGRSGRQGALMEKGVALCESAGRVGVGRGTLAQWVGAGEGLWKELWPLLVREFREDGMHRGLCLSAVHGRPGIAGEAYRHAVLRYVLPQSWL